MTWEETINFIRSKEEYATLVEQAYLNEDLELNIQKFSKSEEFKETIKLIESKKPGILKILDVGCGNGIASIAFALKGHTVVAIDPDDSLTVGTGAVDRMKNEINLKNVKIITSTAEDLKYDLESFDLIYSRQAMHHSYDLNRFVSNCARFLKKNGLFITIRDHVIYNKKDKKIFLKEHPLHKFYQGENAYRSSEYRKALTLAGLDILDEIKFFDSVINYFPLRLSEIENRISVEKQLIHNSLDRKLGTFGKTRFTTFIYEHFFFNPNIMRDERFYSGRMYSYISVKR